MVRAPYTGRMRFVLGFVVGWIVGFLTLWPVLYVLWLIGFDLILRPFSSSPQVPPALLFYGWPVLCGIVGVWVASRLGRKHRTSESPG